VLAFEPEGLVALAVGLLDAVGFLSPKRGNFIDLRAVPFFAVFVP
jgi:hypothetical protein